MPIRTIVRRSIPRVTRLDRGEAARPSSDGRRHGVATPVPDSCFPSRSVIEPRTACPRLPSRVMRPCPIPHWFATFPPR